MPYDLIGTFIVGIAAGLFTWALYRARRKRAPRMLIVSMIGVSMLAYALWADYSWSGRTERALPAGVAVIEEIPGRYVWKPWTYVFPQVDQLIAVDTGGLRRNERFPGVVMVDLILLERWQGARRVVQLVDCTHRRSLDVTDAGTLPTDALPPPDAWDSLKSDSRFFRAICGA